MNMKKLRLLVTEMCNRDCAGCCNKDFNLKDLPEENDFTQYGEILLTGGEPMLFPDTLLKVILDIKKQTWVPIILYTAKVDNLLATLGMLSFIDGLTLTLHKDYDKVPFEKLNDIFMQNCNIIKNISLRLNVFKGINLSNINTHLWKVKHNIKWIKDCPLPEGEVFKRL